MARVHRVLVPSRCLLSGSRAPRYARICVLRVRERTSLHAASAPRSTLRRNAAMFPVVTTVSADSAATRARSAALGSRRLPGSMMHEPDGALRAHRNTRSAGYRRLAAKRGTTTREPRHRQDNIQACAVDPEIVSTRIVHIFSTCL